MKFVSKKSIAFVGLASVALLGGCSSSPVQQPVTTYLDCDDLKQVIASADDDFNSIKRHDRTTRYAQIWDASAQAFNNACSIVSASGPTYYTCSGKIEAEAGESQLQAATDGISQCLGSEWKPTTSNAEEVVFRNQLGAPSLRLHSFENDRGKQMIEMRLQ